MSENGIIAYDLEESYLCPECKRPLGNRWLMTARSGCATCYRAEPGFMVHVKPGCRCR
jgi:protein-arginine kinase activator protein McsA